MTPDTKRGSNDCGCKSRRWRDGDAACAPGHDISFNDGAGSGPGDPGAKGGNGYRPPNRADVALKPIHITGAIAEQQSALMSSQGNSAEAHAAVPGQIKQTAPAASPAADPTGMDTGTAPRVNPGAGAQADAGVLAVASAADSHGVDAQTGWLTSAAWAYLDQRGSDAAYQAAAADDSVAAFAQWLAVEQALARDSADGMPDWLDRAQGADLRGLLAANGSLASANQAFGVDTIGLLAGAELKGFKGLGEGVQKIA